MHYIYKGQEFAGTETAESRSERKMQIRHFTLNNYKYIGNGSIIHLDFTIRENDIK